jgi:hypothetical protein
MSRKDGIEEYVLADDLAVTSPLKDESSSVPLSDVASSVTAARDSDRDRWGCV